MSALEHLALDPARFLSEIYGKKPEVTATGQDFSWLGSLDSFDHLINDSLLPAAAFRMVRDGAPMPVKSYTRKFGGQRDDTIRVADPGLVFDLFAEGATIVLESLHRYSPALRELCRDLETELRKGTQVNAYITPPGAQGFATHVDSHDVFVVQVFGTKHWLVHETGDRHGLGDPLIERDLTMGECLYIPKGFPHSATTSTTASAHLTIGILPVTVDRMKKELTSLLPLDEAALDVRGADVPVLARGVVDQMRAKLEAIDTDDLEHRLTRLFFTSRHHSLSGHLERMLQAEEIDDSDKVVTRVEWVRIDRADEVTVLLPDRELTFSRRLTPALDIVLTTEPFRVSDLASCLDTDERIAFVARLIREGLLELR